ncbi:TPA: DUF2971 domain-containing protein [Escherichia coli]|nr:DUF2971 domain-containing protein [Escherichia coli]HAY3976979.1 DUF2971 domain-containing protein [Escherichia coli]HBB9210950.1 DUF2971 domain-containing protein [Escherichia coli]
MSQNILVGGQINNINKMAEASNDIQLFRYMDFSKFMDLLENKRMFFCNAKYFEDKYEGIMPKGGYPKVSEDLKERSEYLINRYADSISAYVNSWNYAEGESYALWKIYTNPNTGVAIKTTVGNVKKAFNNDDIKIYSVKYIKSFDNQNEDYEPPHYFRRKSKEDSALIHRKIREIYKLNSYKYEREIRAVYLDNNNLNGVYFDVDLNNLIDEIYISPFAPKWFYDLVEKIKINSPYISDKPMNKSEILLRY